MEDSKRTIYGYLECDGVIVRISSIEDIKSFLSKYGKAIGDISENELDELTRKNSNPKDLFTDDCNISYTENPLILQLGTCIENYKIKDGTIAISDEAFKLSEWSRNASLAVKKIQLPDSIIAIGQAAFANKQNLKQINFPESLIKIGDGAFSGCSLTDELILPDSLKYIGSHAFQYTQIKCISLPAKVKKIGSFAFADCLKIESIEFKGVPETIGSEIFGNCSALKEIIIPQGTTDYFIKELFPISKDLIVER